MRYKGYTLRSAHARSHPRLLFEVKVDLQDVRSSYRMSDIFCLAAEWLDRLDPLWTPDMVSLIDAADLEEVDPPKALRVPENPEEGLRTFLSKHFRIQIWKNENLLIYSSPGESKEEFVSRCRELLIEERTREMRKALELALHRFSELERKALADLEEEEMEGALRTNLLLTTATVFGRIRDDFSQHLFADSARVLSEGEFDWNLEFCPDVHDRLQDLKRDLLMSHNEIGRRYERRAADINPYEVPMAGSNIGIVTKGILWT